METGDSGSCTGTLLPGFLLLIIIISLWLLEANKIFRLKLLC